MAQDNVHAPRTLPLLGSSPSLIDNTPTTAGSWRHSCTWIHSMKRIQGPVPGTSVDAG